MSKSLVTFSEIFHSKKTITMIIIINVYKNSL